MNAEKWSDVCFVYMQEFVAECPITPHKQLTRAKILNCYGSEYTSIGDGIKASKICATNGKKTSICKNKSGKRSKQNSQSRLKGLHIQFILQRQLNQHFHKKVLPLQHILDL